MKQHKGGYFRKILHIDMTSGASRIEAIDDEFIEKYLGGRGFAIKLLWTTLQGTTGLILSDLRICS